MRVEELDIVTRLEYDGTYKNKIGDGRYKTNFFLAEFHISPLQFQYTGLFLMPQQSTMLKIISKI